MKTFIPVLLCAISLLSGPQIKTGTAADSIELPSPWNLANAVKYALKNNPQTHIALERLENARASTGSIGSRSAPVISLAAEYSQTDNPMYSFGNILNQGAFDNTIDFNDPGRTDDLRLQAEVRYRIYDGGRIQADTDAAEARTSAADEQLAIVHQALAFEVVKAYHTILQAQEMVHVHKSAIDAISASLEVANARYDAGDLLREDLLHMELQKARAVEEAIRAEHRFQLTRQTFWNLLGIEDMKELPLPELATKQELPQGLGYENRLELKAINNLITSAEAELAASHSGNLPTVDTFANYQFEYGTILGETGDSWMAGVRMDYNLYNGNQTEYNIMAAKARLKEHKAQKAKLRLDLSLELQQAIILHHQSLEKLQVTEKMVEVAQETAKLSRLRFQEGVILASDLVDREMRLTDALARRATARAENSIAIANLLRTTGKDQFPAAQ